LPVEVFLVQIGAAQPPDALIRAAAMQGAPIVEQQCGARREPHADFIRRIVDHAVEQLQCPMNAFIRGVGKRKGARS